jgi:phosphoglycerol transferase MdoB-like AlkP superfamily enzyme
MLSFRLIPVVTVVAALMSACPVSAEDPGLPCPGPSWTIVKHETPSVMWVGETVPVRVRVRNTGTATWSATTEDRLSYHWRNADGSVLRWDGPRIELPRPIGPGEEVELEARIIALADPGLRHLEWEMVRDKVCWYGPPAVGERPLFPIRTLWRFTFWVTVLVILAAVVGLGGRWLARAKPRLSWWLAAWVPVAATWLACAAQGCVFSELSSISLWPGGGWLMTSACVLPALLVALLPVRQRRWASVAVVALFGLLLFSDMLYLRYFGSIATIGALASVGQLHQVGDSVRSLMRLSDSWMAGPLFAVLLLALLVVRPPVVERPVDRSRRWAWALGVLACVLVSLPSLWVARGILRDRAGRDQVFSLKMQAVNWGAGPVHLVDLGTSLRSLAGKRKLDQVARSEVAAFYRAKPERKQAQQYFGAASGRNLILIQAESLQEFIVGARVNGQEVMPFLSSLRKRAAYFPWIFHQTGHGRSSDGEFATLNSLLPNPHGAAAFLNANNRFVALPGVLRDHGYETLSAHAFERGFWNRAVLHPRLGFSRSLFERELGKGEKIGWGLADGVFFSRVAPVIDALQEPFFAFLITLGLHHPFEGFPDTHKSLQLGRLEGSQLGNYIHSMHYLDGCLAEFYNGLDKAGKLRNTVVAIYGDHDSGLWPTPDLLEMAGLAIGDTTAVIRLRRVPLFIALPDGLLAGDVAVVGGQVDIAPSLLLLLGIESPASFLGSPLLPGRTAITSLLFNGATDGTLAYVPPVADLWKEPMCFLLVSGQPRPVEECSALRQAAERQSRIASIVLEYDLAADLTAGLL